MKAARVWPVTIVGALVVLAGALPAPAGAQARIGAGTKDVGLGAGFAASHKTHSEAETVTGVHAAGHVGYLVSEERGTGWLRGQLEVLLEPTLIHLRGEDESATVAGAIGVVRWIFAGTGTLRPFLEAGGGMVAGQTHFRQTNCDVNYVAEGGPGVLLFVSPEVALIAGYRFQHVSNGGACSRNLGLNSSVVHVGLSYFFP